MIEPFTSAASASNSPACPDIAGARYDCRAPGATFVDMVHSLLASADAHMLVAHVQHKLLLALVAAGFSVGVWQGVANLDDNETLAASASTLRVIDPLSMATFEARLRLSFKAAGNGCLFNVTTEACQLPGRDVVVLRDVLGFLSWDATDLVQRQACFGIALELLAERPDTLFAGSDFRIFARRLGEELAP